MVCCLQGERHVIPLLVGEGAASRAVELSPESSGGPIKSIETGVAWLRRHQSATAAMELPDLGAHCSLSSCKRLDFLPVKCGGCQNVFCGEHFPPSFHACEHATDARVPVCPLCNRPVPPRRKDDPPDVAVSAHIDMDCQSDPAKKRRKIFNKRCSVPKCKKKEMVRLSCQDCGFNYCLQHRHPLVRLCVASLLH